MIIVVYVMNEMIMVRKWRESWKNCERKAGRNSVHVVLLLIRNFVAYLAVKLMDICCTMCVESVFQKSCRLVV